MIVDILKSLKKKKNNKKVGNFICFHQTQNKDD